VTLFVDHPPSGLQVKASVKSRAFFIDLRRLTQKKLSVGTSRVANTSCSAEKHFLDRQAQFALWHRVMPLFAH